MERSQIYDLADIFLKGYIVASIDIPIEGISIDLSKGIIKLYKRILTKEDQIAIKFASILNSMNIRYAFVAGYVAILLGRARSSDDIDVIADVDKDTFIDLCRVLSESGYEVLQGDINSRESVERLFDEYLLHGLSIRFLHPGTIVPSIEFKIPKTKFHRMTIENSIIVIVNDSYQIRISPIELQIAYKLWLGSEKDIGDALYLYELFKDRLNKEKLLRLCQDMGVNCSVLGEEYG